MKTVELTCINCPLGCQIQVEMDEDQILSVTGNTCPRGDAYARKEVTHPTRIVTSSVRVIDGMAPVVSVKTDHDIAKGLIFDVVRELKAIDVKAPVHIGDVLLEHVCGSDVNIVATRNVDARD